MTRGLVFLFCLFLLVACGSEEEQVKRLYVEDRFSDYEITKEANDYQVPLNVVLDDLRINYQLADEKITFGAVELTVDDDFAFVAGEKKPLNFPVEQKDDDVWVSLKFLTEWLNIGYVADDEKVNVRPTSEALLPYDEALEIFAEEATAKVADLATGKEFKVQRVAGSYKQQIADVEPLTADDTATLLDIIGGEWSQQRRAILLTVDEQQIAAAILPFPHSGCDQSPFGDHVDNRSGNTGAGINLNSIRDNDMVGVVDIFFYNSIMPGSNRIDERAQESVLEAALFSGSQK